MIQNGYFKRATVNGKKSAIYVEDSKIYLLSYTSAWDDGTKLANNKGFAKIMYIDSVDDDFAEDEFLESLRYTMTNNGGFETVAFEGELGYERVIKRRKSNNSEEDTQDTEQPTVPTAAPSFTPSVPDVNAMTNAFSMMFAGLQQQITAGVMKDLEPTIQKVLAATTLQTRKIDVTSERGVHKVEGVVGKEFEFILRSLNAGIPVYMYGPAGCGKSCAARMAAKALGLDFYYTSTVSEEFKINGFVDANGVYHETEFYKAFTKGGVFMLDEIDVSIPEALTTLNEAIANGFHAFPCGTLKAHKDFRVIAAGNTCGRGGTSQYNASSTLTAANTNRFVFQEVDYDENVEKAICNNDNEILNFVHALRKAQKETGIDLVLGYRNIEQMFVLSSMFSEETTLKAAVFKGLQLDDIKMLNYRLELSESNKYAAALKRMCA